MNRPFILLLLGASGTGKTTVAKCLEEKFGWKPIPSYTTRPPRTKGEEGHIFLSEEAFGAIPQEEQVAYTVFDGYRYCATKKQVEESEVYIIDPQGALAFFERYDGKKEVFCIWLTAEEGEIRRRLHRRGEKEELIERRMAHDRGIFDFPAFKARLKKGARCEQLESVDVQQVADAIHRLCLSCGGSAKQENQ